ncbi:hypothetical protein GCM10010272_69900 [Streptomyces lateritius]|nr:hypothetical protein GCM10010272_69900 [Streptomyces lateritius]
MVAVPGQGDDVDAVGGGVLGDGQKGLAHSVSVRSWVGARCGEAVVHANAAAARCQLCRARMKAHEAGQSGGGRAMVRGHDVKLV